MAEGARRHAGRLDDPGRCRPDDDALMRALTTTVPDDIVPGGDERLVATPDSAVQLPRDRLDPWCPSGCPDVHPTMREVTTIIVGSVRRSIHRRSLGRTG